MSDCKLHFIDQGSPLHYFSFLGLMPKARMMVAMMANQQSAVAVMPGAAACTAITTPRQCGQGGTSLDLGEMQK